MKKIAILCGMALTLGMVACDDMLPNPPAQTNPDITQVFTDADLEVSQGNYGVTDPIVLADFVNQGVQVPVLDITKLDNMPAGYELDMPMIIGSDADFTKTVELATETKDNIIYVSGQQLNDAIRTLITKSPEVQTVNVRFPAFAVNESSAGDATMKLGGKDFYYATLQYNIQPLQNYVIEEAYYLVGNFCDWDVKKGLKMVQTDPSKNLYDSPVFAVKFDVTAAQAALPFEWKVVPASSVAAGTWEGAYGAQLDSVGATTGTLIESPEPETNPGEISAEGPYLVTINAETLEYSFNYALDNLWVAGPGTSNTDFRKMPMLYSDNYITFTGAAVLNNVFFLPGQQSLNGVVFMQASGTESSVDIKNPHHYIADIQSFGTSTDGARIKVGKKAMYWIDANLATKRLDAWKVDSLTVVGEYNGWNENAYKPDLAEDLKPVALKADSKFLTWSGTVTLEGQFKINANNAWNIDFGGMTDDVTVTPGTPVQLKCKGKNLRVDKGTYDVTVNFASYPYTITLVKK